MSTPLLDVRGVSFAYGGTEVLRDVHLAIGKGNIHALVGPNGSGKSTILTLLAGLRIPPQGTVSFQGRDIRSWGHSWRRHLGVVFQTLSIDLKLSARENLLISALVHGISGKRAHRRIDEALSFAGLAERGADLAKDFSGGMRRRLDLARALMHEPDILLLDEPTTGLDMASFHDFWSAVVRLNEQKSLTIVMATHRPDEAEKAHVLSLVKEGRVLVTDPPHALKARLERDVIVLKGREPAFIAQTLASRLPQAAPTTTESGDVVIETGQGSQLVPRVVELFPPGTLTSVSLRPAGLEDVFLKFTGGTLSGGVL